MPLCSYILLQQLMISSLIVVNELVKSSERLLVEHLLETEIKRYLNGFLCSLGSQYIEGTFKCSEEALNFDVVMLCLFTILLSVERMDLNVVEFKISFLRTSV